MSRSQQPIDFTAQRDKIVPHPRILFSLLDRSFLIIRLTSERKLHNIETSILLSKMITGGGGGEGRGDGMERSTHGITPANNAFNRRTGREKTT